MTKQPWDQFTQSGTELSRPQAGSRWELEGQNLVCFIRWSACEVSCQLIKLITGDGVVGVGQALTQSGSLGAFVQGHQVPAQAELLQHSKGGWERWLQMQRDPHNAVTQLPAGVCWANGRHQRWKELSKGGVRGGVSHLQEGWVKVCFNYKGDHNTRRPWEASSSIVCLLIRCRKWMDGLGPLWHDCRQNPRRHSSLQRAAGSSPQPAVASAPWLLGDPTSVLSSFQEGGAVASPVVLLGLSHSGGPLDVWPGSPPYLRHALGGGATASHTL